MASTKTGLIIGVAAAGVAAAALAGAGVRWTPTFTTASNHFLPITRVSTATIFAPPPGAPMSFADIFDKVSPAVVTIDVTSHLDARAAIAHGLKIPGLPFNAVPPSPKGGGGDDDDSAPVGPKAQSSGSGFFISTDGYIVTNNHVVENADDIKVTLKDGREMPAKIVGRDEATDLAVIKVDGSNFPFVDFENSAKPRVGDWVLAVGNPFGLGGTATAGIVSAYGRSIGDQFVDFIQIDAPINRGNSGGPTFDIYGRVIGVNSAIFSPSGGSVGIGFAIPADVADAITHQLITGGKVTRGYLGATIQDVTPEIAESLGQKGRKGALVAELVPGGPADKGGVQSGDMVVELNGKPITGSVDLTRQVAQSHTGDILHLLVLRDGKERAIDVKSGVRPSEAQLAANNRDDDGGGDQPATPEAQHPNALGMTLGALDEATRRHLGLPADVHGVVVLSVKSTSDAGEKGLRAGDILVRVGDTSVNAPADVQSALAHAKQAAMASVLVGVRRDGHTLFLPLKVEK
ncbi:MAG TPA: Do family serine endopeptidase [Caulobacteraceae bacterium]|jgi:serine protease Do|nr:Do family serine endopeptidase [Caulobacteraceae bacterium]